MFERIKNVKDETLEKTGRLMGGLALVGLGAAISAGAITVAAEAGGQPQSETVIAAESTTFLGGLLAGGMGAVVGTAAYGMLTVRNNRRALESTQQAVTTVKETHERTQAMYAEHMRTMRARLDELGLGELSGGEEGNSETTNGEYREACHFDDPNEPPRVD